MSYKDVNVKIIAAPTYKFGMLNKSIILSLEGDIPVKRVSDLEDLKAYLTTLGVSAPKLEANAERFLGQVDAYGNPVAPEYFYVLGKASLPELQDELTKASSVQAGHDFYAVLPIPGDDVSFNTWLATYANTFGKLVFRDFMDKVNAPAEDEIGPRVALIYGDTQVNDMAIAWAGRTISMGAGATKFKDRTLTGMSASDLTNAEVELLNENGVNCYIYKYGAAQTDGSICSDKTTHIDQIWTRDTIITNMEQALQDLMRTSETLPFDANGVAMVEATMNRVLTDVGNAGMLAVDAKGNYEFEAVMPMITGTMRSQRLLDEVKFWYIPSGAIEKITIEGYELFEAPREVTV